jgi:type IV pilus assembly protein PilW
MKKSTSQSGFSLIDLLVGTVVGMLTILLIMYSFKAFESQKRATDSMAGAQSDGLSAINVLDLAIRQSGAGLFTSGSQTCSTINIYHNGTVVADGAALMPVAIADGGAAGASDVLQTVTSTSPFGAASVPISVAMPSPSAVLTTSANSGANTGDLVLVGDPSSPGTPCTVMGVTNVQATGGGVDLQHNPGTSAWNPANPANVFTTAPAYGTTARVVPIGSLTRMSYQAICNSLASVDLNSGAVAAPACVGNTVTNASTVAANVVNIQAQYGVTATAASGTISCWVNATGSGTNACDVANWATPGAADVARIKAVRVAVTVRSPQLEKPGTAGACTATASTSAVNYPVTAQGGPTIDVTGLPNWQCYKYKVFQTIIPMRNVIWAN